MKMKLFIVLVACLLLVRGEDAKSDEVKPQAEKDDFFLGLAAHAIRGTLGVAHHAVNFVGHVLGDNKDVSLEDIEGVLDEISKTDNQEKKDFLLGLAAHAIHGTLGAAHGALNLVGHALIGDEKITIADLDDIFAAISKTDNQEKKDFFLGLLHHAVRGVLSVGHHALNLVGHIAGDNKDVSLEDIEGVLDEISKTDNQEKKDFLLGLAAHAIHGTLGAAHGAINLVGHVLLGDEKTTNLDDIFAAISETDNQDEKDFLLGLAHHYVRGAVGVLHHNVNFVGHVVGDDKYETSEEIPTPQFDNYRTTERVY